MKVQSLQEKFEAESLIAIISDIYLMVKLYHLPHCMYFILSIVPGLDDNTV